MADNTDLYVAGAQLASTAINAQSAANTNKKQRQWSEKMYDMQKKDAEAQWHMQNEYNTPASQMQRLESAGLNPNLVYGKGADVTGGPIRGAAAPSWTPKAPTVDLASPFQAYQNYKIGQAQADNLKVQNTVMLQEAALKAAQIANTTANTARSKFDLDLSGELRNVSIDVAKENLRKLGADATTSDITASNLGQKMGADLQNSVQELLLKKAQTANSEAERRRIEASIKDIENSADLKRLDIELKKNGVQPGDQIYWRVISRILSGLGLSISN